jgi:hypothetical protein
MLPKRRGPNYSSGSGSDPNRAGKADAKRSRPKCLNRAKLLRNRLPLKPLPALFRSVPPQTTAPGGFGRRTAGTSEVRKWGKLRPNFWNFFSRKSVLVAWMGAALALLPDTVGQMQLMPCSSAVNFWKKTPENPAGKPHTGKAARSAIRRPADERAMTKARWSIRSLPLTP